MREQRSPLETFFELLVFCAVAAQTFLVVNEATDGEAGRRLSDLWHHRVRPRVVRVVAWLDAKAIMERAIATEIMPLLEDQ